MGWDEQQTHRLEMGVGSRQERRETSLPQFNMQRQAILKYLKDIMLLRTHYTTDCRADRAGGQAGRDRGWNALKIPAKLHSNEIIPCKIIIIK